MQENKNFQHDLSTISNNLPPNYQIEHNLNSFMKNDIKE